VFEIRVHADCSENFRNLLKEAQNPRMADEIFRFGAFAFDCEKLLLTRKGEMIALGHRAGALLAKLLKANGKVVSKDDLINAAWPGQAVEDSNLSVQIAGLRKVLGQNSAGEEWITTAQRLGYQFVVADNAEQVKATRPDEVQERPTIAVLPFGNLDGEVKPDYFALGLVEDLITELSNLPGLAVIAQHSSAAEFSEAADLASISGKLGARYLLLGNVRRSHTQLRISTRLLDSKTMSSVWAERYDRELSDLFAVQEDVAKNAAQAIFGKFGGWLRPLARSKNPEAHDLVLRSRDLARQSSVACDEALSLTKRAVALEPDYAEAHRMLAVSHILGWSFWGKPEADHRQQAVEAAKRAVELDPRSSGARWVRGFAALYERNWEDADLHYHAALELNHNDADARVMIGDFYVMVGTPERTHHVYSEAFRLNPRPPDMYFWLRGQALTACSEYDAAIATLMQPETRRSISRRILAAALALKGEKVRAREEADFFMRSYPDWTVSRWTAAQPFKFDRDRQFWAEAYRAAGLPD
jgi:TolB-like protein